MNTDIPQLTAIFDWLEFTVFGISLKDTFSLLRIPFDDFVSLEKGRYGYQNQLKWSNGNLFVMYTSTNKKDDGEITVKNSMGIHILLTGTGCRHYESIYSMFELLEAVYNLEKVNFSRVDIAIDDFSSNFISYDRIHKAAIVGNFISRWTKWDEITSREVATGNFIGRTMYFGSQNSDIFCRVYDKSLERRSKGTKEVPEKWTRLEIVYRKERAKRVIDHLLEGLSLGEVLRGTLRHYLRFLKRTTDRNKSRWPTSAWWDQLLEGVSALKLTTRKNPKSIEEMATWVDKQIAPTMAAIVEAHQGDLAWLRSILIKGSERLSQRHKDAINRYLSDEGELTA